MAFVFCVKEIQSDAVSDTALPLPDRADLMEELYEELHKLAVAKMAREQPGHTLQPTALVHEAWLRLGEKAVFQNRGHFFGAAAKAMRRILVDRARHKRAERHGGTQVRLDVTEIQIPAEDRNHIDLLALDEALAEFEREEPYKAKVVGLHYFAGLTFKETAEMLHISERNAKRHWEYARTWLFERMTMGE